MMLRWGVQIQTGNQASNFMGAKSPDGMLHRIPAISHRPNGNKKVCLV